MKMNNETVQLAYEYYSQGNSLNETVEWLSTNRRVSVCQEALRKRFVRDSLPLRKMKESVTIRARKHIDTQEVVTNYQRLKSIREVSELLKMGRGTVKKILRENGIPILDNDESLIYANRKHERTFFQGSSKEKAYLYGFVVGDVHVFKKSKFTLRSVTRSTHKSFVELFENQFKKYGKVNVVFKENRKEWALWIDLDYESFRFLEERKATMLPNWITDENFYHFLAGFVDSDGSVQIRKAGEYFQYVVRCFGQDKEILEEIGRRLERDGFRVNLSRTFKEGNERVWRGVTLRYNKDYYTLEIYRKEDTLRLLSLLPLQHKEKIMRKDMLLSIFSRGGVKWAAIKGEIEGLQRQLQSEVPQ